MNRLSIYLLFFLLLFSRADVLAQCGTLYGHVFDLDDQVPLEFASIYVIELDSGTMSDENGEYRVDNICDSVYTIRISHVGCETIQVTIQVKGNTHQDFFLPHNANILREVQVVAKRPDTQPTQVKSDISGREFEKTKGKTLGEGLKKLPGVSSIETGSSISKPVIHGLHSNRILVLNNGIRQEGQQWGSEHAPEIDPFIANKLSVIKGANSVRYGSDAIAGVILVEPKPLRDSAGFGGELNLAGFSNNRQGIVSGIIEQNFARMPSLSWRLQGTLKQAGNSKTPGYWLKNTGFKEYNFSYAAGWKKENYDAEMFYSQFNTTLGIFSGSHIGNLTDLQNAFNRAEPLEKSGFTYKIDRPRQHVEHELFKTKLNLTSEQLGKFSLVYARQYNLRSEYDKHKPLNNELAALNEPELQYEITSHTADLVLEHKRKGPFSGNMGISGMRQHNTYEGRYFIPFYTSYSGGIFLVERWQKNKLELEAGIRYDQKWLEVLKYNENNALVSPTHQYQHVSGMLGSIYKIDPHLTININAGSAWRAPGVNELYSNGLHHGAAAIEKGDPALAAEKAYNFIASANYHNNKRLNGELSFYHTIINNFIYQQPVLPPTLTIRGAFPTFIYKQVDATFTGMDISASYVLRKRLVFSSKASLLRAFNKTIGDHLIMMPSDRYENELTYEFRNLKRIKNAYAGISLLTVMKQSRVPVNSDFAPPPDGYALLNMDAGFSVKIKKQMVDIGLGGNNLLNTVYRDYLNRFRYYSDATGRNITVRMKIPF